MKIKPLSRFFKARKPTKPIFFREEDRYLDELEFQYILWLDRVYQKISTLPGHIVEVGVARGRNAILFGRMIKMNGEQAVRNYYGFDTFDGYSSSDMSIDSHLSESEWRNTTKQFVDDRLKALSLDDICFTFEGDVREVGPRFIEQGHARFASGRLRVALLYIDCNAYGAAKFSMDFFKDYMSPGGIICIDEKKQGGETRALEEFAKENGFPFLKDPGPFGIPAYTKVA